MTNSLQRLLHCARGATAVEYGFILGLVVVAIIVAISSVGGSTSGMWNNMAGKVAAVAPSA